MVAEGVAMDTVVLSATTTTATVKKAGKGVEITDEAALSGCCCCCCCFSATSFSSFPSARVGHGRNVLFMPELAIIL